MVEFPRLLTRDLDRPLGLPSAARPGPWTTVVCLGLFHAFLPRHAQAEGPLAVLADGNDAAALEGIVLVADSDDDDDNRVTDSLQTSSIPTEDLRRIVIRSKFVDSKVSVAVEGPLRLVRDGAPLPSPLLLEPAQLPATLWVQGVGASRAPRDAAVIVKASGGKRAELRVTVVSISILDSKNNPVSPAREGLGVSREITNDSTLPREDRYDAESPDAENFRVEVFDPRIRENHLDVELESFDGTNGGRHGESRSIRLVRPRDGLPFRSAYLRLVGDEMDSQAPGVSHRVLHVGLRDVVRVTYASPRAVLAYETRVGRPGDEAGPRAARKADLRIRVLRAVRGGAPVVGMDDSDALRIAREQIAIANEVWVQCFLTFGVPEMADVRVVDPPPPTLLSVSDGDGLPAAGQGVMRFRINKKHVAPVHTRAGAPPIETALALAQAIKKAGFEAHVTENPKAEFGAGPSADLLVRTPAGEPVTITPDGRSPLSTDARQSLTIGVVELNDGLTEFNNMNAASGTLEERTLVKALGDEDPATIDIFIVNRFAYGTRQGEAFIKAGGGAMVNTLILDRNGVRQQRQAWTQAHEIGHVLLNQPYHPDNVGADRPWLLMDADNSMALVTGPKRLSDEDCRRAHRESGPAAMPPLLKAYLPDVSRSTSRMASSVSENGAPLRAPVLGSGFVERSVQRVAE